MASPGVFDFCLARKAFTEVLHQVVQADSLEPYKEFVHNYPASKDERRVTIDQALRDVLRDLSAANSGCEVFRKFICLSIEAATTGNKLSTLSYSRQLEKCVKLNDLELCSPSVPFMLLTDIFDVIPLNQCEELFGLVEDKVHIWKSATFYITGKNFLLRMCNDMLRRLSKSQNTVFCGRIQLFLSRLFPLAEKSALNLMSQFNLENVTLYTQVKPESEIKDKPELIADADSEELDIKNDIKMDIEDGEMEEHKSEGPIDYNLYRRFWSLQDYFRKPGQCFEKKLWSTFAGNADTVFDAFASSKLDDMKSSKKKLNQRKIFTPDTFFAKYLTSEKLLNLQLNDSNFRRYVLVQFLIIFQYLNAPVKFKSQNQVLTDEQAAWMKASTEKIYQLIKETPPDGDIFAKTVEHILCREEHWNNWKNDGCPDFERHPPEDAKRIPRKAKRRRVGDELQSSGGKVIKMGNPELTKLWNLNPNNMDACKAEDRMFLPMLEDFFQEAIEQNDPEAQVEEKYKLTNDQTFQWKALRLLARRSPQFFTNTTTPALELKVYLNSMLSKLAKQMPMMSLQNQTIEEMKTEIGDEEEIKESHDDHFKQNDDHSVEKESESHEMTLNKQIIDTIAQLLGRNWKKLASELNFEAEDIAFYESEGQTDTETACKVLTIWSENEEIASVASLQVALNDIGLGDIAETVFGSPS